MKNNRIMKAAGLSVVGFCAVALAADRVGGSAGASQVAGFCGAFLGALLGQRRLAKKTHSSDETTTERLPADK